MSELQGGRAFVALVGSGLLVQALSLASGPLVARMLGPVGRGEMALVIVVAVLFSVLGSGGLPAAISHVVAAAHAPARDVVRGLLRIWLSAMLVPSVLAGIFAFVVNPGADDRLLLGATGFAVCYGLTTNLLLGAMLQGEGDVRLMNRHRLVGMASYVGVVAVLFVVAPVGHTWVVLAIYAMSQVVGIALCWTMLRRPARDPALRADHGEVLSFARRAYVSGLRPLDSFGIDQILVGLVLGHAALGFYTVALSMTGVSVIIMLGVATALLPRMVALPDDRAIAVARRWIAASAGVTVILIVGLQLVLEPALRILFGEEFLPALPVARVLAVAWGALALRRVLASVVIAQDRPGAASMAELAAVLVLVPGLLAGMHWWGLEGAGVALLAAGVTVVVGLASLARWRPA